MNFRHLMEKPQLTAGILEALASIDRHSVSGQRTARA